MPRTEALIRAQRKYDAKRPTALTLRLSEEQLETLARLALPDESTTQAAKRLVLEAIAYAKQQEAA